MASIHVGTLGVQKYSDVLLTREVGFLLQKWCTPGSFTPSKLIFANQRVSAAVIVRRVTACMRPCLWHLDEFALQTQVSTLAAASPLPLWVVGADTGCENVKVSAAAVPNCQICGPAVRLPRG